MADVATGVTIAYNSSTTFGDCRSVTVAINNTVVDVTHLGSAGLRDFIHGDLSDATITAEVLCNATFDPSDLFAADATIARDGASLVITATALTGTAFAAGADTWTFSKAVVESFNVTLQTETEVFATIVWKAGGDLALS